MIPPEEDRIITSDTAIGVSNSDWVIRLVSNDPDFMFPAVNRRLRSLMALIVSRNEILYWLIEFGSISTKISRLRYPTRSIFATPGI